MDRGLPRGAGSAGGGAAAVSKGEWAAGGRRDPGSHHCAALRARMAHTHDGRPTCAQHAKGSPSQGDAT
eukprot:3146115-Alexandrium_andersonii.AAC.1